ncbi:MAG: nitrous oxide reductase family maturation protein NosD [Sutterellaceae bacterium]|nr:nitrous oxide reductase family maturation protein NosD [Sutterellaceae bacterium]
MTFLTAMLGTAEAAHIRVTPADDVAKIVESAKEGDVIEFSPGVYKTNLVVRTSVTLTGTHEAVIDAQGKGSGIMVRWPKARVENLTVKNFGASLYDRNAGVRVTDGADDVVIKNMVIEGPAFGIRADRLNRLTVEDCKITGIAKKKLLDRGDGVYLNYVRYPKLTGNVVKDTRDGFYFENVDGSVSRENAFSGGQYGIHYMYTRNDSGYDNFTTGAVGGYALMSSRQVKLERNTAVDSVEFGILVNVCERCTVTGNRVEGVYNPKGKAVLDTEGKALFIYGPGASTVTGNYFADAQIGVGVAMGGEGVKMSQNAFVDNRIQVRYVGKTALEWSVAGKGNYWSTFMGWDFDGDGLAEKPYQPNDSLDRIFWIYPEARFLMDSPVVALLRWLALQFEIDRGKGITDSHPLIKCPEIVGAQGRFASGFPHADASQSTAP